MRLDPACRPALVQLAGLLLRNGRKGALSSLLHRAATHHRQRLRLDPLDGRALLMLREIHGLVGDREGARAIESLTRALAGAAPRSGPRPCALPSGSVLAAPEAEELLLHPGLSRSLAALLQGVAPWFAKLVPGDLRRCGLERGGRVPLPHHLSPLLANLHRLLGLAPPLEAFSWKQGGHALEVLLDPPSLAVGSEVLEHAPEPELRFHLAGALLRYRQGMILPLRLTQSERRELLEALAQLALAERQRDLPVPVTPLARELARVVPAGPLRQLAPHAAVLQREGIARQADALPLLAMAQGDRLGLLAAGDPAPALAGILRRDQGPAAAALAGEARAALLARLPAARELICFAASPEYLALQRLLSR